MPWDGLEKRYGQTWPAIRAARARADEQLGRVQALLDRGEGSIDSGDISLVVFGSLARREWTSGSDLDWTLLIDGQADHRHALAAHEFEKAVIAEGFKKPGPTGVFGNLAFSHNLIHQIGGDDDSNENTTRRMLLLLESRPVGRDDAHKRVLRGIISRYLENDYRTFRMGVPHFLLNDLQRFWRTMCVDYAYKNRVRAGKGWALRVVKLRLSRKLIFAAGLLACLQCDPKLLTGEREHLKGSPSVGDQSDFLLLFVEQSPLDIVADGLGRYAQDGTTVRVLNAYDQFLAKVHDPDIRKTLEDLQPKEEENHPVLLDMKAIGKEFQQGIVDLFFTDHPVVAHLTRQYGLF